MNNHLKHQLNNLPAQPGVYLFKNHQGEVLYVGKAKRLRSRVLSYFRASADLDPAKQQMIPKIKNVATITTDNETEALVLEANLIRQHQPPYNVVLRDDKYYLFIKITTNEDRPRIFPVRQIKSDGARYFGPYSSANSVRRTLKLLRRIFPYREEKESPREKIFPHPLFERQSDTADAKLEKQTNQHKPSAPHSSKSDVGPHPLFSPGEKSVLRPVLRPVLRSLGEGGPTKAQNEAPAEQAVDETKSFDLDYKLYRHNITNIIKFLQGHRQDIIDTLTKGMKQASKSRHFERATIWRDQLRAIERLEGTQKVYLARKESFDCVSIARAETRSAANVFSIRDGKLLGKNTFLLRHRQLASAQDVLRQFLLQYYRVAQDIPRQILIPLEIHDKDAIAACLPRVALAKWGINADHSPKISVPKRGKKKKLLAMGEMNAQQILDQEEAAFETDAKAKQATVELAHALGLDSNHLGRIETYDISNIQGTLATGSMIVFTDGKPDKSQYRKFRIKIDGQPDDFKMLQEVLSRRFAREHDNWPTPDLVLIDGGKGQLNAVKKILDQQGIEVPLASLAKREEELFIPNHPQAIQLPYNSPALYLIQRMRDEAHRFTITYHQLLRSKRSTRSILDEIPGIGPATKKKLLNHFGSLTRIRQASDDELTKVVGAKITQSLRNYL